MASSQDEWLPVSKRVYHNKKLWILGILLVIIAMAAISFMLGWELGFATETNESPRYLYRYAGAATGAPQECSKIATDVMAHCGGASDAVIAATFCVGVMNAQASGLGGGHLAVIYDTAKNTKKMRLYSVVARETAPAAATENMYVGTERASQVGGLAIAVPGEVAGLYEIWRKFGRCSWDRLVYPSIKLCENGFFIPASLGKALWSHRSQVEKDPGLRAIFYRNGKVLGTGDRIRMVKLGKTLRKIADGGKDEFYSGSLSKMIVDDLSDIGAIITANDLAQHTAVIKEAAALNLTNSDVVMATVPPPSSGLVVGHILKIIDNLNVKAEDMKDWSGRVNLMHKVLEAMKFGFAKRTHLGDDDYAPASQAALKDMLMSDEAAAKEAAKIKLDTVLPREEYGPVQIGVSDAGTSQISVLAPDGSAVSLTSTINLSLGALVAGTQTGIIWNDEMDDFSTPNTSNAFGYPASASNYIAPGKRPMSSMSPHIILRHGNVLHVGGASGGSYIISACVQTFVNVFWLGMNPMEAVNASRLHHQLFPDTLYYEKEVSKALLDALARKGHFSTKAKSALGKVQVVSRLPADKETDGAATLEAVSDRRKGGEPFGF